MQWEGLNCARKMAPNLQAENNYETSNIFNEPTGFFPTVLNQLLKVLLHRPYRNKNHLNALLNLLGYGRYCVVDAVF